MADGITVHVIDDDEAMRQSLSFLLASADIKARTYESATVFLEHLPAINSGCVITDVRMHGMSGLQLLRHLKDNKIDLPVIVITGHGDVPLAVEAMKYGARDFLEKPFDDEVLLQSIRAALKDQATDQERQASRNLVLERLASLTNRERDVLDGLVAGHPNKVIAFNLGISPRTVEIYRAGVMTKMEANSLSDLVRMAMIAGVSADPATSGR